MTVPVASPVPREAIEEELAALGPVAAASRGGCLLYSFRAAEAPMLMREVGRLREAAFRSSGGGTGLAADIDGDDVAPGGYRQMVAWDVRRRAVAGGYRYIVCSECDVRNISTSHYFRFSREFRERYMPHAVELGRSFVAGGAGERPAHTLFSMDSLWQGLGAVVASRPDVRYLFGKVTVYRSYDAAARRLLMAFMRRFFGAARPLLQAFAPESGCADDCGVFASGGYAENYALLLALLRERGERIPPMISAYMRLCPSMQVFDTTVNGDFGRVYETAVLLPLAGIRSDKRARYLNFSAGRP